MNNLTPKLTIGVVTYKRVDKLRVLLSSFVAQTRKDFRVHVIHDGSHADTQRLIEQFRTIATFEVFYEESPIRFDDYGHSLRDMIIEKTFTEYTLLTNDDNYYVPTFVEEMMEAIDANDLDIVYCNMIHSHVFPESKDQSNYQLLDTKAEKGRIDIGCFIVRTEIAKQVGFKDKGFDGDGTYFESCLNFSPFTTLGKIKKVLFVHN